jgi:hypothetical protein
MSKGTKVYALRIPPEQADVILATIERLNLRRVGEPLGFTSFILACVDEKLRHLKAGNRKKETQT